VTNVVQDWAKAIAWRIALIKKEKQEASGKKEKLEYHELSPTTQWQLTHLWEKSNEIFESCLRISADQFNVGWVSLLSSKWFEAISLTHC